MAGCIAPSDRSEYRGGGGGCFESSFRSMLFCRFHYPPMCVFRHRPLHTYMDINEDLEDYHRRPTFPELLVTKLVVTQGTIRYQMKDMDIIFLLIPISLLWVKRFGCYSLSKSSIFF